MLFCLPTSRYPVITAAVLGVLLAVGGAVEASFTVQPYVVWAGSSAAMSLQWRLSETADSYLAYGQTKDCADGRATTQETSLHHMHKVALTGLMPDTRYFYRVTASGQTCGGSFLTSPINNESDSLVFYGIADPQGAPTDQVYFGAIARLVRSEIDQFPQRQTFCLVAGDWIERAIGLDTLGDSATILRFMRQLKNTQVLDLCWQGFFGGCASLASSLPLVGCVGNHDVGEVQSEEREFRDVFHEYWPYPFAGGQYGSLDWGPVHISVVDLYSPFGPGSIQLAWLESDLREANTRPWTIVLLHQAVADSAEWSRSSRLDGDEFAYLHPLLTACGVDLVLSGDSHCHSFWQSPSPGGISGSGQATSQLVMSLSAGYPDMSTDSACQPHFYRFTVTSRRMTIEAVNAAGEVDFVHEVMQ